MIDTKSISFLLVVKLTIRNNKHKNSPIFLPFTNKHKVS